MGRRALCWLKGQRQGICCTDTPRVLRARPPSTCPPMPPAQAVVAQSCLDPWESPWNSVGRAGAADSEPAGEEARTERGILRWHVPGEPEGFWCHTGAGPARPELPPRVPQPGTPWGAVLVPPLGGTQQGWQLLGNKGVSSTRGGAVPGAGQSDPTRFGWQTKGP